MLRLISANGWTFLATTMAVLLAAGWAWRERSFADEKAALLQSRTVNQSELRLADHVYEGKPRGEAALYFNGPTPGTRSLVVGQFRLKPGEEPHPIHQHVDEEILVVSHGKGEITCDGKTTPIGPGSVMYTAPNVPHGIKNTGAEPIIFYFVKWVGYNR